MVATTVCKQVAVQVPVTVCVKVPRYVPVDPCGSGCGNGLGGNGCGPTVSSGAANACDACAPGLAGLCSSADRTPIRDFLKGLFVGRLCADPCAKPVCDPCAAASPCK